MNLRGERPLCLLQLLRIARDLQSCLWVLVGAGTGICEHANECVVLCGERSLDVAGADDQDVTEACVDQRLRVRRILRTEDGKHVGMHLHDDLLERSHREARPSAACLHSSQREVDEHRLHNHGCASGAGGKSTMFCFCGALSFEGQACLLQRCVEQPPSIHALKAAPVPHPLRDRQRKQRLAGAS